MTLLHTCPLECGASYAEEWQLDLHCWASDMGLLPAHPVDSDIKSWWKTLYPTPPLEKENI